jgi:TRAP-type transport system periplasmic protein
MWVSQVPGGALSFGRAPSPYLDNLAKELGPHADRIKDLIRGVN